VFGRCRGGVYPRSAGPADFNRITHRLVDDFGQSFFPTSGVGFFGDQQIYNSNISCESIDMRYSITSSSCRLGQRLLRCTDRSPSRRVRYHQTSSSALGNNNNDNNTYNVSNEFNFFEACAYHTLYHCYYYYYYYYILSLSIYIVWSLVILWTSLIWF